VADACALQTPLAGIEAGLAACGADLAFVCAADMAFVGDDALLEALFAHAGERDAVVPVNGGVRQPLCAVYRPATCVGIARDVLREGAVGPKRLLDLVRTELLEWPDERPFLDADTPEALAALERLA
jgi:molybdopterin-guanine dinucleotide biosynthesis protein A